MITHRPLGSGHPYSPDTEQRWPVIPVVGQPLRLGVRTSGNVNAVSLEIVCGHEPARVVPLLRVARSTRGQTVDGGHLASAQARKARQAGGWEAMIDVESMEPIRYRFVAASENGGRQATRWFFVRPATWISAPETTVSQVGTVVPVVPSSVEVLSDGETIHRVRFALPLSPAERVVGFGERYDRLDQRGTTLDNRVFEQYKNQGATRRTYMPMPFAHVIGGTGWGFHVRTGRQVWFDAGESSPDRLQIEAQVDAACGQTGIVELRTYSGDPADVLDQFLAEIGRPTELPEWVFRLWASGNEWNTQAEVVRQVCLHAEHGIPVGNVVIEAWSDESTFTIFRDARYAIHEDGSPHRLSDFTFPADGAWPDPKGMVDALHGKGIRVHLWQIPLLKMRPHPAGQAKADAEAAQREDVLVREIAPDGKLRPYRNRGWWFPLGLMPDLTEERAAEWWTDKRRYLVEDVGIDGFKTDGGEHAWGSDLVYLDGGRGDAKNNMYPVAYAAAYGRLLEACGKAPVTFSRAGYVGSQAHGAYWAGDENSSWEAFRWSMMAGLNASACGMVYWGWDIAGFSGPVPSAELYVRAMAASAFVPIMQYHSEFNHHRKPSRDRTPWNIAEQTGDPQVIDEVRRIVRLRERLVPYLSEQARTAVRTGRPLMRALFFDYPSDKRIWEYPIQWKLGDDVLVAPVVAPGVGSWEMYLPAGEWVNAWTGERVGGEQVVDVATERHQVPVFVAAERWESLAVVFRS